MSRPSNRQLVHRIDSRGYDSARKSAEMRDVHQTTFSFDHIGWFQTPAGSLFLEHITFIEVRRSFSQVTVAFGLQDFISEVCRPDSFNQVSGVSNWMTYQLKVRDKYASLTKEFVANYKV